MAASHDSEHLGKLLYTASWQENQEQATRVLAQGANVDWHDDSGLTSLHIAALNGHESLVRLLLDRGASINAIDEDSNTPLHYAARKGHESVVRLLLDRGAITTVISALTLAPGTAAQVAKTPSLRRLIEDQALGDQPAIGAIRGGRGQVTEPQATLNDEMVLDVNHQWIANQDHRSSRDGQRQQQQELDDRWMIPLDHLTIDESSHLGSGALGEVKRAMWNNSIPVAVKRLFFMSTDAAALRAMGGALDTTTREAVLRDFIKECSINSSIRHPNIVMFLGVGVDRSLNDEPRLLVLELMERGSLHDEIYPGGVIPRAGSAMTLDRIASILLDVSRALVYLHHSRTPPILHLDLKPKNVLIDGSGRAKIGDLGEAHVIRATRRATRTLSAFAVGTPGYMAPEMAIEGAERGRAADMFSLGVMACEMSSGRPPNPGAQMVRVDGMLRGISERERREADMRAMQHSVIRELVDHLIVDEEDQRWDARQVQSFIESIGRGGGR